MKKIFLSANDLLRDSYQLALKVLASDFSPNFVVGVWRGGAPIAIAMQELFDLYGLVTDHGAIKTSSYDGMQQQREVVVSGLANVLDHVSDETQLLIVDDVFDTGKSIAAILKELESHAGAGLISRTKIATLYYKPTQNTTNLEPDFIVHKTSDWLVFPHELKGLNPQELASEKGIDLPDHIGGYSLGNEI